MKKLLSEEDYQYFICNRESNILDAILKTNIQEIPFRPLKIFCDKVKIKKRECLEKLLQEKKFNVKSQKKEDKFEFSLKMDPKGYLADVLTKVQLLKSSISAFGGILLLVGGVVGHQFAIEAIAAGVALTVGAAATGPIFISLGVASFMASFGYIGHKVYKQYNEEKTKNENQKKWDLKDLIEIFGDIIKNNNLQNENAILVHLEEKSIKITTNPKFYGIGIKFEIENVKVKTDPNINMEPSKVMKEGSEVEINWNELYVTKLEKTEIFEIKLEFEIQLNALFPDLEWLNDEINKRCK